MFGGSVKSSSKKLDMKLMTVHSSILMPMESETVGTTEATRTESFRISIPVSRSSRGVIWPEF